MVRDTTEAARRLMNATGEDLALITRHDPDMIRDVSAALIHARASTAAEQGCGHIDCVNACDGEYTHETCPNAIAARAR